MRMVLRGQQVQAYIPAGKEWQPLFDYAPDLPPVNPPEGKPLNIVTACSATNLVTKVGSLPGYLAATYHKVLVDAAAPVMRWQVTANGMGGSSVGLETRARFFVSSSTQPSLKPLTFAGEQIATIPIPGDVYTLESDPLPINLYAGETLTVYAYVYGGEPGNRVGSLTHRFTDEPGAVGEYPQVLSSLTSATQNLGALRPSAVVAPSDQQAWVLGGDSIVQEHNCHLERWANAAGVASVKSAKGGEAYRHFPRLFEDRYARHVDTATHFIDELGINDYQASGLEIARLALAHWKMIRSAGIEHVIKTTVTPFATSTDGFATVENQTAHNTSATVEFNRWLRDGAPLVGGEVAAVGAPAASRAPRVDHTGAFIPGSSDHPLSGGGIVDMAAAGEAVVGSGLWATGYPTSDYGDSLHPGPGWHQRFALRLARDIPTLLNKGK